LIFGKRNQKKQLTDDELIAQYKRTGETWYVGELFQRYTHLISALALNYLKNPTITEDAVMDIFEVLVEDLKKHEVKNFKAWLYSVTKNHCLKKKRQLRKETIVEADSIKNGSALMEFEHQQDHTNEAFKKNAQLDQLEEAINLLAEEQKKCVQLFYIEEKSYKEVAEITGYSMNQVKSYIQNGKRKLKGYLKPIDE
jgi:RNA polymerase sigma factor (sigma-70 family)